MEKQVSDLSMLSPPIEGESQVDFHKQLHEVIARCSLDLDAWTSLITEIDKTYPDNIETICLVYDSFLSKFPLCHGYWRKYVRHMLRLCTVDKVVEIFERAVQSATYSVSVWVDYCSFSMSAFENPFDVRRLFKRAICFVGKDYLCHTLWDKYIEFEFSQQQWNFLAHVYIQTLRFPTKKLHRYYDNFKKFTAILKEEMEVMEHQKDCSNDIQSEAVPDVAISMPKDEISHVVKDILDSSISPLRYKALQKYTSIGEQFYQEACCLDEKIHCFETYIRRPYFHSKPLDDNQLENWHHYLDFIEMQEDFDWAVKLYERCLIPCASYPEFWMRYVEFMETKGGREVAKFALDRATQIFLKNVPVIHIFSAWFKERMGEAFCARAAFRQCDMESNSQFIEYVIKEANMEKRLGNFAAAYHVYERALELAKERQKLHAVPTLYIHFSRLKYVITGSIDAAIDVIVDGIQQIPHSKLLLEGLINLVMVQGGPRQLSIVDSIIGSTISGGTELSQGLGIKDREDLSLLYLELIDHCGTTHDIRKAWNRHIKLFPHLIRNNFEHPTSKTQLVSVPVEGKQSDVRCMLVEPSGDHGSDHQVQLQIQGQDQHPLLPEKHAVQPDQIFTDQFQQDDNNDTKVSSPKVEEQYKKDDSALNKPTHNLEHESGDDACGPMESTDDLVHQSGDVCELMEPADNLLQSGENASEPIQSTNDLIHQVADGIASLEASLEHRNSVNVLLEQDNEFKQNLKPPSPSLSPSDKESGGLILQASCQHFVTQEIPTASQHFVTQETPTANGTLELCQNANVNPSTGNLRNSADSDSAQIPNVSNENGPLSPSSSTSNQNYGSEQVHLEPKPSNSDDVVKASADANSGNCEQLQDQQYKQELVSPQQQNPPAGMNAQRHASQNIGAQNQYQAVAARGNLISSHACATEGVQQHSILPESQSQLSHESFSHPQALMSPLAVQNNEQIGHTQSNQTSDLPLQHFFHQQQQSQQPYVQQQHYTGQLQQLQPQQQQQDQQQLLLLQHQHYLQQQQQHLLYLQQQHYQHLQQLQHQQGHEVWQQMLQQHQQQQNHQLQQWQQLQQGYEQLQQQQEYQQKLQQTQLQPWEEYQKLQQLSVLEPRQRYQQMVQYHLQQQQEYQQQLQQAQLQRQGEHQNLQQPAELQVQQGYWRQQQQQLQLQLEQPQHQQQITSAQIPAWDNSCYQQGQQAVTEASRSINSPHPKQESPSCMTPSSGTGTSGRAASPHHQLQYPHGVTPNSAGASECAASPPHPKQESPQSL